jgi:succinate dehydrogenase / fumarate reductase cytochrome b subunit
MASIKLFLKSSVGRKFLVGITGLGLSGFVLIHMSGNMLMFVSPEAYNTYGHKLITNPLIYVAEAGLVTMFLVHMGLALSLAFENKAARPIAPSQSPSNCEKNARFGSRYMAITGIFVLAFVILHLITFKYGPHYPVTYNGVEMRDLHKLIVEKFKSPLYSGWYLFSMLVLFVHLAHGFSASFQSLGFFSVRNHLVKKIGWAFAFIVAGGFFIQPIYGYFYGGN